MMSSAQRKNEEMLIKRELDECSSKCQCECSITEAKRD